MKKLGLLMSLLLIALEPAQAYIDPGTGSSIMSIVIGLAVSIGLVVKTYWYKIVSFFTSNKQKKND